MLTATGPQSSHRVTPIVRLFRHSVRKRWGRAALLWEHDGKRGYRFEDGAERTFKEGFYHLFEPVPATDEAAASLIARVQREREAARQEETSSRRAAPMAGPTWTELLAVFRERMPQGFADPSWERRVRGVGASRRAKRHREAAIAHAAERLGRDVLEACLQSGRYAEVVERALEVLAATDLVTPAQRAVLEQAPRNEALARALFALMHEPDPEGERFDHVLALLVRGQGGTPTWTLLTALRALVDPHQDVCVHPRAFFVAAGALSVNASRPVAPQGRHYNRLLAVARELRDRLRDAGESPRDLLDVYDFIWETCRPGAATTLAQVRLQAAEAARSSAPAQSSESAPSAGSASHDVADEAEAEAEAA